MATLKDVARASGVSPTSVSLVLNGRKNKISKETKERIKQVAKELDFEPNKTARSLATKKTNTIGVIIPDISNTFFSESVRHIQIELSKHGYDMFLCNSEEKFQNDLKYLKLFSSRNVDGIIITMSSESLEEQNHKVIHKELINMKVPYILFDRFYNGSDSRVSVDNLRSGYEVTKHLIENGHTNLGIITGPLNLNSSKDRLAGALKALSESGLTIDEKHIIQGKYDMESGKIGAEKLFGKVTAIFAFNDLQAYGVMEMARLHGLKIPDDISLVGFDDNFYSEILDTRLTTVRQPIYEMSKKICDILMDLMHHPENKQELSLRAEFIKRDSVKNILSR